MREIARGRLNQTTAEIVTLKTGAVLATGHGLGPCNAKHAAISDLKLAPEFSSWRNPLGTRITIPRGWRFRVDGQTKHSAGQKQPGLLRRAMATIMGKAQRGRQ